MPKEKRISAPQKKQFAEPRLRVESTLATLTKVGTFSAAAGDDGDDKDV